MPSDGPVPPPTRALRPGARRTVALVDMHDERLQPAPPRLVVERVREVAGDAGKARRRKREQVLDLPRAARQRRIHSGPLAQAPQPSIVLREEEPLDAERPVGAEPDVRAPQPLVPEP